MYKLHVRAPETGGIWPILLGNQWQGVPAWCLLSSIHQEETHMLSYALTFFVIALIAAALGLGGVAGLSANIGWLFAVLAVVLLAVTLISGRRSPPIV